ncbi:MAG: hypothetical protein CMJ62_05740 [Planctomycetaceae bacterium]|nr:hypothetical protein [Planctomycetaceae bacterium]
MKTSSGLSQLPSGQLGSTETSLSEVAHSPRHLPGFLRLDGCDCYTGRFCHTGRFVKTQPIDKTQPTGYVGRLPD